MSDAPGWLAGESGAAAPVASVVPSAASSEPPMVKPISTLIKFINMALMIFLAFVGAMAVKSADSGDDIDVIFVGIYVILFAAIEFLFEISQFCTCFDGTIKRNFGFLYGPIGKCCYFLFMGILAFGMRHPRDLSIGAGIAVAAWGPILYILSFKWPAYFDKLEKYEP